MDIPHPLLIISLHLIRVSVSATASNVPAIFIFGDSIFDAGNNHYNINCTAQADFPPYGSSFFHRPTGRFTNGRTVADFISQFVGIPLQKPFLEAQLEFAKGSRKDYPRNGLNFASAGSGVLIATNYDSGVTPLQVQLQQFRTLVEQNHIDKNLVKKSLFFLESGSNDIFNYFLFGIPTVTPDACVQAMLSEVVKYVDTLHKLGARRIAIYGLGPVGCVPARINLPGAPVSRCYGKMNKMVKNYNLGLENIVVQTLPVKYPDAIGVYGDVYKAVQDFKASPQIYGFRDVSNACCGYGVMGGEMQCGKEGYSICKNPNDYLFWDFFHPSEHTYKLISKALWAGGRARIRPFNLKRLTNITLPHM